MTLLSQPPECMHHHAWFCYSIFMCSHFHRKKLTSYLHIWLVLFFLNFYSNRTYKFIDIYKIFIDKIYSFLWTHKYLFISIRILFQKNLKNNMYNPKLLIIIIIKFDDLTSRMVVLLQEKHVMLIKFMDSQSLSIFVDWLKVLQSVMI